MRALAILACLWPSVGFGAALTPAVNSPLLSMSGGTAPSTICTLAVSTVISTTTETSLFAGASPPLGNGCAGASNGQVAQPGQTVAAGVQYSGNQFLISAGGVVTTPLAGGSITLKIKYGSVAVINLSGVALSISLTNQPWQLSATCTIKTWSASASSSTMSCYGSLTGATSSAQVFSTTSDVTIDTSVAQKVDATWTWGSVSSQTMTVIGARLSIEM